MPKPIVKYPGGKRDHAVIGLLADLMARNSYDTYLEPFVGGASVFLALKEKNLFNGHCRVVLGDADAELISLYNGVIKAPPRVAKVAHSEAAAIREITSEAARKKSYNSTRELYNLGEKKPGVQLFLRHACFNGLFRRSKSGDMNTPPRDQLEALSIPSDEELEEFAHAFEGVELLDWDFRQYEEQDSGVFVGPGTIVYSDSPYDGGFVDYIASGFGDADHAALIEQLAEWSRRGATCVYSNAATPLIDGMLRDLWPEAKVDHVAAKRAISSDGDRTEAPEVIAYVE